MVHIYVVSFQSLGNYPGKQWWGTHHGESIAIKDSAIWYSPIRCPTDEFNIHWAFDKVGKKYHKIIAERRWVSIKQRKTLQNLKVPKLYPRSKSIGGK